MNKNYLPARRSMIDGAMYIYRDDRWIMVDEYDFEEIEDARIQAETEC